eukprot:840669-Prorocentrum_minimum.AAC.2
MTVRVSFLGSDDGQGPGFRCEHLMLAPYGVWRGCGGGAEGIYRSRLDARQPQNPTNSEEYQGHLQ